jgi:malate synthase
MPRTRSLAYRNWLGLMKGDLSRPSRRAAARSTRRLAPTANTPRPTAAPSLKGRALMLVRNVGHLMTNPAILTGRQEVPEGLMDAMVTVLIALHDLKKTEGPANSVRARSMS